MSRRLALLGAAVVVALGCDHAHTPKADLVRDCDSRVEGGHVPSSPRGDLDAGPIVFYGLRSAGREALRDPRHAFQTEKGEYPPVKTITEAAASTVVTV